MFRPAVATADPLHPVFTRGFLEYSQRRGFIADAARARHPKDKPKVERGVQYARERFFKGGEFKDLADVRDQAQRWCSQVAGLRIHGTTRRQPLVVFQDEERQALLPWDGQPYEIAYWRTAKVHQDHHIQCQQALCSVPYNLCPPGQGVEVRVDSKLVRIYHRGQLIKTHVRQPRGGRATDPADYPAELSAYTTRAPDGIKASARELGPAVAEFAERLFDGPLPWAKVRQGHKLLRLGQRYTAQRLDAAAGPWRWTSSMCAASSASCSRPWSSRRPRNTRRRCPRAASPAQVTSLPKPTNTAIRLKETTHDHDHRTHAIAQAAQAGRHG